MAEQQPDIDTQSQEAAPPVALHKRIGDPALALTAVYLLVSAIGALNAVFYYSRFDLNIFNFWEASDIFLAGFRHPSAFLWSMMIIGYGYMSKREAEREARKQRNPDRAAGWFERSFARILGRSAAEQRAKEDEVSEWLSRLYRRVLSPAAWTITHALIAAAMFFFLLFFASHYWNHEVAGLPRDPSSLDRVAIVTADGRVLGSVARDGVPLYLVGTSNRFIIVWDGERKQTQILPWDGISSIDYTERDLIDAPLVKLGMKVWDFFDGDDEDEPE